MAKKISSKDLFEQEDIFKGVRDSAEKTLISLNKINDEFKQTAATLKQSLGDSKFDSSDSIKKFTQATAEANKIQKQAIEIEKLKEQVRQQAIKSEKEQERLQQERIKTQKAEAQEKARLAKESEKAAKANEVETGTLAKLQKANKDLRAERQQLNLETATGQQRLQEINAELNKNNQIIKENSDDLKKQTLNIGNYESATVNLKTELRALTRELMNMSESDPKFQEMAQRAGELKDQIQDTQAVVKATAGSAMENFAGSVAKVGQIGVAAFQGIESSMVLLGVENEAVLQSMQKLQALAGLGDALKTLGGLGDMLTEIRAGFTAAVVKMGIFTTAKQVDTAATVENTVATGVNTAATEVQTVATTAQATATTTATGATRLLSMAMKTLPIVAIAAGIIAIVYALDKYLSNSSKAAKEEEKRNKELKKQSDLLGPLQTKMNDEIGSFRVMVGMLSETNAGSKERSKLISEINAKYGTTLKNLSDEKAFQDQLNNSVINYIALQKARYKVEASGEQLKLLFKEEMMLEKQLQKEKELAEKEKQRQQKTDNYMGSFEKQNKMNEGRVSNTQKLLEKNRAMQQQLSKEAIDGYNQEKKAMDGLGMSPGNPGNINPQQKEFNNELEKTVDLTREIQDEQIKQIKDENERAKAELITNAERRIEDIQNGTATETQKAQLIREININLQSELLKIEKEALQKKKDLLNEEAEFIKKNREEIANEEQQAAIDQTNKEMTDYEKRNEQRIKARYALLDEEQLKEYNRKKEYNDALVELDILKNDGAFQSEEEYQKAVALLNKKYDDKAKKAAEDRQKTIEAFAQKTTEYFKKKSDEKIAQIDKEIAAAEKQNETLKTLAAEGNINAQQSLAENQRIIDQANLRKEKQLKKQQRIEAGLAIFKLFSANADKKNPLAATIADTTGLLAFISSLPMFYDGTEDTGTNGKGIDGKGGFHAVLHPNERVVPKSLNEQIGSMSNEQLAKLAQEYQNGRLVAKNNANSSLEMAILVNEMRDLKEVIKNKPETNIALGEITQSAMQIVESKRTGNTTIYNRFRVSK